MITGPFDLATVAFRRRVIQHNSDEFRRGDDVTEFFQYFVQHRVEEILALASDVRHVVKCLLKFLGE